MKAIMAGFGARLYQKSIAAVALLEGNLSRIMLGWVAFVVPRQHSIDRLAS